MIKTTLRIDGMACGMCEAHINDVIRKDFRVKKVSSSRSTGLCEILSPEPIPEEALRAAINVTGYTLLEYRSIPYEKKSFLKKKK